MADLNFIVLEGFAGHYRRLAAQVRELASPLDEAHFWRKPFGFGNSVGHLVLHLTGNLNYYLGAEVAGSGYVRDREREFAESEPAAKFEVLRRFDEAIAVALGALRAQNSDDWGRAFTAMREEDAGNRFGIFLRCGSHLHHHVGQITYLVAALGYVP